jgi:lipopolysaccharide biosynthesis regulator YciM
MSTFWLFLLLFSAIGCGWLLGRYASGAPLFAKGMASAYSLYYRGLNFLLNDRADEAMDAFLESLEVTPETFETHLALGNLMRRKGVVERAIQIHQNLLARPSLPPQRLQQAHLELARDFISAGLYDRAERLLQDLVQQSEEQRPVALRHLIEIYQSEREWEKAIETAKQLLPRRNPLLSAPPPDPQLNTAIAHFHCELAQRAMDRQDYPAARSQLKEALERDRHNVRASILQGRVEFHSGNYADAAAVLRRVQQQDPALLPQVLDTLRSCYEALQQPDALRQFLQESLAEYPSSALALALAEEIARRDGPAASGEFLAQEVRKRPTLRGALALLDGQRQGAEKARGEEAELLHSIVRGLVAARSVYQCGTCGFAGRQLHWQCPSCKQWGTMKPIRGVDGD